MYLSQVKRSKKVLEDSMNPLRRDVTGRSHSSPQIQSNVSQQPSAEKLLLLETAGKGSYGCCYSETPGFFWVPTGELRQKKQTVRGQNTDHVGRLLTHDSQSMFKTPQWRHEVDTVGLCHRATLTCHSGGHLVWAELGNAIEAGVALKIICSVSKGAV